MPDWCVMCRDWGTQELHKDHVHYLAGILRECRTTDTSSTE
jgi:hypothetical protein